MKLDRIFCVIDPTTNNQRALDRARFVASGNNAHIHAYICIATPMADAAEDRRALQEAEIARHEAWLERLVTPLREEGREVTTEVECRDEWRDALAPAAERAGADLIIKSAYRRSALRRRLLKTSDFILLRSANCPVLLVKTDRIGKLDRVLAAVNIAIEDDAHRQLTDRVIDIARTVAETADAELHCVNAYSGSLNFVHPPDLAKRAGIERRQAHVGDAEPAELIAQVAEKIEAPLVVIGSVARRGVSGAVVGNTAEKILDTVPADILTIITPRS